MKETAVPEYKPWHVVQQIGKGSFGCVYEIQREDFGEVYKAALKVISIPRSEEEMETTCRERGLYDEKSVTQYYESAVAEVTKEFAFMTKLKGNTNIVSYEDHQLRKHANGIGWDVLVRMELLTPLSKYVYMHPLYCRDVVQLGIDICNALERCKRYEMIHRDIKMDNIFVSDQGDFKLGDFGVARIAEHTLSVMSKTGTPNYMAPEVEKGQAYGSNVDIYSLGVVMYRLLNCDRFPFFPSYPQPIVYQDVEKANIKRLKGEKLSCPVNAQDDLGKIVLRACEYNPEERYSDPVEMKKDLENFLRFGSGLDTLVNENLLNHSIGNTVGKQSGKKEQNIVENNSSAEIRSADLNEGTVSLFFSKNRKQIENSDEMEVMSADSDLERKNSSKELKEQLKDKSVCQPILDPISSDQVNEKKAIESDAGTISLFFQHQQQANCDEKMEIVPVDPDMEAVSVLEKKPDDAIETEEKKEIAIITSEQSDKGETNDFSRKQKKKRVKVVYVLVAVCAGIAIAISVGHFLYFHYTTTELPDVIGQTEEKAAQILQSNSLQIARQGEEYSDTIEKGNVIRLQQSAGEVLEPGIRINKNTKVFFVISAGQQYIMENYVGMKEEDAKEKLQSIAIDMSVEQVYSEKYAAGIIMTQDIAVGEKVSSDTVIHFHVSKGVQPFKLKDYVGKSVEAAAAYAKQKGLKTSIKKVYNTKVKKGFVVSQMPKSGVEVKKGDKLSLTVSKGPKLYKVPNLVRKTEKQAAEALKKHHLKLGKITREYNSTIPEGLVIRQSDVAGKQLVKNSQIAIVVSLGEKPVVREQPRTSQSSTPRPKPRRENVTPLDELEVLR